VRLTVLEAPPELSPVGDEWERFARGARGARADLLLLNELPFGRWISAGPAATPDILHDSRARHAAGLERLAELGAPVVLGTRPVDAGGRSTNEGFVWTAEEGLTGVHTKQFFPCEEGYWESRWFERGETHFRVADAGGVRVGFLICTEVMFTEWARHYGRSGAHLIVVPRAVGPESLRRWRTALAMAAVASGCYVATSNRAGRDSRGQEFGGRGWIFDPLGDLVAETSAEHPFASAELDLDLVETARRGYPCYVEDLPPDGPRPARTG
jgi:N-carbamoylputrescine amidase